MPRGKGFYKVKTGQKMSKAMKKSTKASPAMDMGEMKSGFRVLERADGLAGKPVPRASQN